MVSTQQYLIAGRFFTTMGHFLALLILFTTIENNIEGSLGDDASSTDKRTAYDTSYVRAYMII